MLARIPQKAKDYLLHCLGLKIDQGSYHGCLQRRMRIPFIRQGFVTSGTCSVSVTLFLGFTRSLGKTEILTQPCYSLLGSLEVWGTRPPPSSSINQQFTTLTFLSSSRFLSSPFMMRVPFFLLFGSNKETPN